MKMIRVDDDVHEIITAMAVSDDRGITAFLNRHFREINDGKVIMKDYAYGTDVTPERIKPHIDQLELGDILTPSEPTVVPLED